MSVFNKFVEALNSIDNAAKVTLEDTPAVSATSIRSRRKAAENSNLLVDDINERDENDLQFDEAEEDTSTHSRKSNDINKSDIKDNSNLTLDQQLMNDAKDSVTVDTHVNNTILSSTPINGKSVNEIELKKLLRKKSQEIEKLNLECLELEKHSNELKQEVQEAWDTYKLSQEKAIIRETELQDEIRQIQKAKQTDKQQSVAQLLKLNEDLINAGKQIQALSSDKEILQSQIDGSNEINRGWSSKYELLEKELNEAKTCTVQGVQQLRDELRTAYNNIEQLRLEHVSLIRQNQIRQAELERENSELINSLTEKQKEISKLQNNNHNMISGNSLLNDNNKDYQNYQQEIISLTTTVEKQNEIIIENERRIKLYESEIKATQISIEDERKRNISTINDMSSQIHSLEDKVREFRRQEARGGGIGNPLFLMESSIANNNTNNNNSDMDNLDLQKQSFSIEEYSKMEKEIIELRAQAQNLSKILLKKQALVLELQSERSALKSRVNDLQNRCTIAEQKLESTKDLEGDFDLVSIHGEQEENNDQIVSISSSLGGGLRTRGGGKSNSNQRDVPVSPRQQSKVIKDLEKIGVKPSPSVSRAVTMIDTYTLLTGRFLRSYPLVRMGFVLYFLLLHLWVLFILVIHTHSLELDTEPKHSLNP
eukprot:gene14311-19195_t